LKIFFDELHRYFWFDLTQILISKKVENEIVFESSVLAWIRNRIRIEQKFRIRKKSIRIHNPGYNAVILWTLKHCISVAKSLSQTMLLQKQKTNCPNKFLKHFMLTHSCSIASLFIAVRVLKILPNYLVCKKGAKKHL
jgi:hypothetical protein